VLFQGVPILDWLSFLTVAVFVFVRIFRSHVGSDTFAATLLIAVVSSVWLKHPKQAL
jgi:ABC-type anion transport system duplicated permease subunit